MFKICCDTIKLSIHAYNTKPFIFQRFTLDTLHYIPNGPLQVGQQLSFGRQLLQTRCPL